jgi:hypothetical protein
MMHMDGSRPTGFLESTYNNGKVYKMPNNPLRCIQNNHPGEYYPNCEEYKAATVPEDEEDEEVPDKETTKDPGVVNYRNYCKNLGFDSTYVYTCYYNNEGDISSCSCV